jgi:hypothetical protein
MLSADDLRSIFKFAAAKPAKTAPPAADLIPDQPLAADFAAETARRIIAAGAARRGEQQTGAVPPAGEPVVTTASEIVRCAALARGEIEAKAPKPTGLAAEILAAGQKARAGRASNPYQSNIGKLAFLLSRDGLDPKAILRGLWSGG